MIDTVLKTIAQVQLSKDDFVKNQIQQYNENQIQIVESFSGAADIYQDNNSKGTGGTGTNKKRTEWLVAIQPIEKKLNWQQTTKNNNLALSPKKLANIKSRSPQTLRSKAFSLKTNPDTSRNRLDLSQSLIAAETEEMAAIETLFTDFEKIKENEREMLALTMPQEEKGEV